jgi:hypothetical protein
MLEARISEYAHLHKRKYKLHKAESLITQQHAQELKNMPLSYGTRRPITVFTGCHEQFLP